MAPQADRSSGDVFDDDVTISPFGIANAILRQRRAIVALAGIGVALGLVAALQVVPRYEAVVRFVNSPSSVKAVAGVGDDMGLVQQRDPFDYYSSLLTSTDVLDKVLATPLPSGGTIADAVMQTSRAAVPAGPEGLRRQLAGAGAKLEASTRSRTSTSFPVLSVRAGWTDPQMAADLANAFVAALAEYDQTIRSAAAKDRREFIANQIVETQNLLKAAEENLRTFRQRNRLLMVAESAAADTKRSVPPALELRRDQLQREVTVQSELYLTLKKGFEQARISELDEASPIVILDEAAPPRSRTGQSRSMLVLAGGFLGLVVGLAFAGVTELRRRADLSSPEAQEFVGQLVEMQRNLTSMKTKALGMLAPEAPSAAPPEPKKNEA